jgi:hypothetical protein
VRGVLVTLAGIASVLGLLAGLTAIYTSGKLQRGRMVRGEVPGATYYDGTIRSVQHVGGARSQRSGEKLPDQCAVDVEVEIDGRRHTEREWADEGECRSMRPGGPATLARVPGDDSLYLKNGTWASPGNGRFDEVLLAIELVLAGAGALATLALGLRALLARRR